MDTEESSKDVWDDVDTDFGGDETGNFGPRKESGTALYQVDTLATISPRGEVNKNPEVFVAVNDEQICVSAGTHLSLFDNGGHKFLVTLAFESPIDGVAWSEQGKFLVVGENNGGLHLLDSESHQILFSQMFPIDQTSQARKTFLQMMFTPCNDDGHCELLVLTSSGRMIQITKLYLPTLYDALKSGDFETAKQLQSKMSVSQVDVSSVHSDSASYAVVGDQRTGPIITAGDGKDVLCEWKLKNGTHQPFQSVGSIFNGGCGVKKCQLTQDRASLVVLDENNTLSLWDVSSLLLLDQWMVGKVQDFILLEPTNSLDDAKTVVLTASDDGQSQLQILPLGSDEAVYTLQLGQQAVLPQCPSYQEEIYIVEGVLGEDASLISSLRLRCLTKAEPETRLYQMLHKKQFKEAELFASQFGLDVQLVYKVKSSHLQDQLSSVHADKLTDGQISALYGELKETLLSIKDDGHIAECCSSACMPTFSATYELLNYAKNRLIKSMKDPSYKPEEDTLSRPDLLTGVMETAHRLRTYQVTFGAREYNSRKWEQFLKANLLVEVHRYLAAGQISQAFSIWRLHQREFEVSINCEVIGEILDTIPHDLAANADLRLWLCEDFIPLVIRTAPEGLAPIAAWIERKARTMEVLEKENWPHNAVEFAQLLEETCVPLSKAAVERRMTTPAESVSQVVHIMNTAFHQLQDLIAHLKEIIVLREKYNLRLSLLEYSKESHESITYRMLDRVKAIELIPSSLEKVIVPYMEEHNLQKDKMLFQYIGDLLSKAKRVSSFSRINTWESKAIAVIACIQEPEYKFLAILEAIHQAHIPWSPAMQELVNQGLQLKHERVEELRERVKLAGLRSMLLKYDLIHYNVNEQRSAETLIYYVLNHDGDSAVEDALQVAKAYTHLDAMMVYMFRTRFLLQRNRVKEVLDLMQTLPKAQAWQCGQRLVIFTKQLLDENVIFDPKEGQKTRMAFTKGICEVIKYMLVLDPDHEGVEMLREDVRDIQFINSLQVEYAEFVSLSDYQNKDFRSSLLVQHYRKLLALRKGGQEENTTTSTMEKKPGKGKKSMASIYRLAELLQINRETLMGELAIQTAQLGIITEAISICSELFLCMPSPETGEVLHKVAHILCAHLAESDHQGVLHTVQDLPALINRLAQQAASICAPELLADCLELSKCTSLAEEVFRQCETGEYGAAVRLSSDEKDVFQEELVGAFFKEDGLVLDSKEALPLAYHYAITCIPKAGGISRPYEQNRMSGQLRKSKKQDENELATPLSELSMSAMTCSQHVMDNSQIQLAFGFTLDSLVSLLMHVTIQDMGAGIPAQALREFVSAEQEKTQKLLNFSRNKALELVNCLLNRVLNHSYVDLPLAVGLLLWLPKNTAVNLFKDMVKKFRKNYRRLLVLARVGVAYAEVVQEPQLLLKSQEMEVDAKWGHRLAKYKIDFGTAFMENKEKKHKLLERLVNCDDADVPLVTDYCSAFGLDETEALLLYLTQLFLPSKEGRRKEEVDAVKETVSKAQQVTRRISNKDELLKMLKKSLEHLDPYDYERLKFVLEEMHKIEPTAMIKQSLSLLEYLFLYKRSSPPNEKEMEYSKIAEEDQVYGFSALSPLSKTRLPFHPFLKGEPWKVVSPELTADTVTMWLPVAHQLKLPREQVFLITIQNLVNEHVAKKKGADGKPVVVQDKSQCNWNVDGTVNLELFATIHDLLTKVGNMEAAMACARWTMTQLPMGAEKVLALKACALLAKQWHENCPEGSPDEAKAKEASVKFSSYYRRLCTEQILFQNGLHDAELLSLSNTPGKLLIKLYEHQSILQRELRGAVQQTGFPDIHAAAKKIAETNTLDLNKVFLHLVDKWLPSTQQDKQEDGDTTFNFGNLNLNTTMAEDGEMTEDEVNLRRVVYVLKGGDIYANCRFLLNVAFLQRQAGCRTHMCRFRALQCLFLIMDKQEVEESSSCSMQEIQVLMQNLLYVSELDNLHMQQSLTAFDGCSKEGLVRGIWRNHSHDKKAVRLVCDMCLDYEIFDIQLWNSVLQQLLTFSMLDYLRYVLVRLEGQPQLWQVSSIQRVWKSVLMTPLTTVSLPLSDEQHDECLQTANLLHRCPVLGDVDLVGFADQFLRLEMYACAAGCLMVLPDEETRNKQIKRVLSLVSQEKILQQLQDINVGGRTVPMAQQVEECIYQDLYSQGQYDLVYSTTHYTGLLEYLIQEDCIEDLLVYEIKSSRMNDALKMLTLYCSSYPESSFSQEVKDNDLEGSDKLKVFLQEKELFECVKDYHQWEEKEEDNEEEKDTEEKDADSSVFEK